MKKTLLMCTTIALLSAGNVTAQEIPGIDGLYIGGGIVFQGDNTFPATQAGFVDYMYSTHGITQDNPDFYQAASHYSQNNPSFNNFAGDIGDPALRAKNLVHYNYDPVAPVATPVATTQTPEEIAAAKRAKMLADRAAARTKLLADRAAARAAALAKRAESLAARKAQIAARLAARQAASNKPIAIIDPITPEVITDAASNAGAQTITIDDAFALLNGLYKEMAYHDQLGDQDMVMRIKAEIDSMPIPLGYVMLNGDLTPQENYTPTQTAEELAAVERAKLLTDRAAARTKLLADRATARAASIAKRAEALAARKAQIAARLAARNKPQIIDNGGAVVPSDGAAPVDSVAAARAKILADRATARAAAIAKRAEALAVRKAQIAARLAARNNPQIIDNGGAVVNTDGAGTPAVVTPPTAPNNPAISLAEERRQAQAEARAKILADRAAAREQLLAKRAAARAAAVAKRAEALAARKALIAARLAARNSLTTTN